MASDSTAAITPANTGLFLSGMISTSTAKQPDSSPANPRPVTARPKMNIVDDEAEAHSNDPIRKITLLVKKTALIEKYLYSLAKPN